MWTARIHLRIPAGIGCKDQSAEKHHKWLHMANSGHALPVIPLIQQLAGRNPYNRSD